MAQESVSQSVSQSRNKLTFKKLVQERFFSEIRILWAKYFPANLIRLQLIKVYDGDVNRRRYVIRRCRVRMRSNGHLRSWLQARMWRQAECEEWLWKTEGGRIWKRNGHTGVEQWHCSQRFWAWHCTGCTASRANMGQMHLRSRLLCRKNDTAVE